MAPKKTLDNTIGYTARKAVADDQQAGPSEVAAEATAIHNSLMSLGNTLGELEARLAPVLHSPGPADDGTPVIAALRVPLAAELHDLDNTIQITIAWTHSLIARLGI